MSVLRTVHCYSEPVARVGRHARAHFSTARAAAIVSAGFALALAGCGDTTEDPPGDDDDQDEVAQSLTDLGVDITESPRQGDDLAALPDDYSPFGNSRSFDTLEELVLLGTALAPASGVDSQLTLLEIDRVGNGASYVSDVLFAPDPEDTPWASLDGAAAGVLRDAVRGDFDGDGLEELAVVFRASESDAITLEIYDDQTRSFAASAPAIVSTEPATGLELAAGDFDGDGLTDLMVGLLLADRVELYFARYAEGTIDVPILIDSLPAVVSGSTLDVVLEVGNIDYDPSMETVAVLNELYEQGGPGGPEAATTRYVLFDDGKHDFAELDSGPVRGDVAMLNRTAIVADVALGDIDGDGLDEVVFAGLTHLDPEGACTYDYLVIATDDRIHERAVLGAAEVTSTIHGGCAAEPGTLRFVHADTLDIDGDGFAEVQVNGKVFEDFRQYPPWTAMIDATGALVEIPQDRLFGGNTTDGFSGAFGRHDSAMAVADLTADKRQDLIFYSQATNVLEVWGLSDPDPDLDVIHMQWRALHELPVATPLSAEPLYPVLLPLNVNHDSLSIAFDDGTYQLVFTEPVLLAALAAAPCYADLGQNTDACRTSFGTADSVTIAMEDSLTITAGTTIGFDAEFSVFGVKTAGIEVLTTMKSHISLSSSSAYTLTNRVVFTTGPIEDSVIFTTVPLDQYTYTITSHSDPELIGSKVVVAMPRDPVQLQVSRDFYNAHAVSDGPRVDESVFGHAAGDPTTYPARAAKDELLGRYPGFQIGPAAIGEGAGDRTMEINVATEVGLGVAYGAEFELSLQATAGVVVTGFSIGFASESSLQIVRGAEALYAGTVANLPAETFAQNDYSWGMFTYVLDDHPSEQQFEVINYWVE